MGRIQITVLGGAGWISGVGSAANATLPPCAEEADVNSVIQSGAHQAGAELRKLPIQGDFNSTGGDLSKELTAPVHKHVNEVCNPNPRP